MFTTPGQHHWLKMVGTPYMIGQLGYPVHVCPYEYAQVTRSPTSEQHNWLKMVGDDARLANTHTYIILQMGLPDEIDTHLSDLKASTETVISDLNGNSAKT